MGKEGGGGEVVQYWPNCVPVEANGGSLVLVEERNHT